MFSHLYTSPNQQLLPFSEYVDRCRTLIAERRPDLAGKTPDQAKHIIDANTPFELKPAGRPRYGALLIHGLLNCPFAMREVGTHLQAQGILSRSILLPGHGTRPDDLLHITYQDWIQTVQYGIQSLRQEVDQIYLVGFSTGASLSVLHALSDENIAGLILLSPAIKIKTPIDIIVNVKRLLKRPTQNWQWVCHENEIDYVKYQSIPFNAVTQVSLLTQEINKIIKTKSVTCPIFMAMSHEDETISSSMATHFFTHTPNSRNELLLYSAINKIYNDPRIQVRSSQNLDLGIKNFSHLAILFSSNNSHYGFKGDYPHASNRHKENVLYGAFNPLLLNAFDFLCKVGLTNLKREELTYNPDFDFMMQRITTFLLNPLS